MFFFEGRRGGWYSIPKLYIWKLKCPKKKLAKKISRSLSWKSQKVSSHLVGGFNQPNSKNVSQKWESSPILRGENNQLIWVATHPVTWRWRPSLFFRFHPGHRSTGRYNLFICHSLIESWSQVKGLQPEGSQVGSPGRVVKNGRKPLNG